LNNINVGFTVVSNGSQRMNNKFESTLMLKEVVVVLFEVLSWNFPGGTDENYEIG
jgi:hypothetical protein